MTNKKRCRPRYPNNIPRRQSGAILIMGDGESEKTYFEHLSDLYRNVHIRSVATAKTGPAILIRKTREHVRKSDFDSTKGDIIAIVMDLDDRFAENEIREMELECNKLGFHLIISNPSFEVWLMCHYRIPTHPYTATELYNEMDAELRGYNKSRGIEFNDESVDKAVTNAEKLLSENECNPTGCCRHNPSTTVYSLVKTIRNRNHK